MYRNIRYVILVLLLPVSCVGAELNLQTFSIEIPDGWISAPDPDLREYEKLMKSRTGLSKSYEFGIQPSGRNAYFMEPPFILGTFQSDQKNTEKEIEAMAEQLNKQFQSTDPSDKLDSDSAALKNVFDNSTFETPYLDAKTKCIYSTISTQTPAYGLVHAVTIQRLSPHGKVILSAYVSDETKEEYSGVINRMISSISFSPSLGTVADDVNGYESAPENDGTKGIMGKAMQRMVERAAPLAILMIICFVIGLVWHFFRGNKEAESSSKDND